MPKSALEEAVKIVTPVPLHKLPVHVFAIGFVAVREVLLQRNRGSGAY